MLTKTIPSYAYFQYQDDADILAFVQSFNSLSQDFVDWFVSIGLPIYTGPVIVGPLLDWVAEGLYGSPGRPALPSGQNQNSGTYNTLAYNTTPYNGYNVKGPQNFFATTDDIYKRILTWNFYKGDGNTFNIRWLKRRIMRFLTGLNGTDPGINQTYQVSVSFGVDNQVNIRLLTGIRTITGGALYNRNTYGRMTYGTLTSTFVSLAKFQLAPILKSAIDSGAVELPFQYTYVVNVS